MKSLKIKHTILLMALAGLSTLFSCKDKVENPPDPNEEELITTVELSFTDTTQGSSALVFRFADPDGEGGNDPTETDTIRLSANTVYNLSASFLDESSSDIEDITEEIEEESADHLICYTSEVGTTVTIQDADGNSLPIGLEALVETTNTETGLFTVVLKHQPDIKTGSCDLGETDVEVPFVFEVL